MSAIILRAAKYILCKTLTLSKTLQTTNYKPQGYTEGYYWELQLQTTKLKYKLILQCKHTITLEYYNTTVLKFTPKKENNQISINILKLIYLKYTCLQ